MKASGCRRRSLRCLHHRLLRHPYFFIVARHSHRPHIHHHHHHYHHFNMMVSNSRHIHNATTKRNVIQIRHSGLWGTVLWECGNEVKEEEEEERKLHIHSLLTCSALLMRVKAASLSRHQHLHSCHHHHQSTRHAHRHLLCALKKRHFSCPPVLFSQRRLT